MLPEKIKSLDVSVGFVLFMKHAINVLGRGQRLLACGEDGSGQGHKTPTKPASVKQEQTDCARGFSFVAP